MIKKELMKYLTPGKTQKNSEDEKNENNFSVKKRDKNSVRGGAKTFYEQSSPIYHERNKSEVKSYFKNKIKIFLGSQCGVFSKGFGVSWILLF